MTAWILYMLSHESTKKKKIKLVGWVCIIKFYKPIKTRFIFHKFDKISTTNIKILWIIKLVLFIFLYMTCGIPNIKY